MTEVLKNEISLIAERLMVAADNLDRQSRPEWRKSIDLNELDESDENKSILGQLYDGRSSAPVVLKSADLSIDSGFYHSTRNCVMTESDRYEFYVYLNEAWKNEVQKEKE